MSGAESKELTRQTTTSSNFSKSDHQPSFGLPPRRPDVPTLKHFCVQLYFFPFFSSCTCLRNSLCVPSCVSPSLSLSLHLSLFLCCCVAPGDTVMCPPSVPPSLSLSLCPCHLQLLCETRHTAWGREAGRVGETQGGRERKERGQGRGRRRERQLYRQRK